MHMYICRQLYTYIVYAICFVYDVWIHICMYMYMYINIEIYIYIYIYMCACSEYDTGCSQSHVKLVQP